MAATYGVSRSTLREALRLLEVQGLLSLKPGPGGGPAVGTVEPGALSRTLSLYFHVGAATYGHVMQTQVMLESMCAELAATHPDRADVLAPFLEPFEEYDDTRRFRQHTTGFHTAVYLLADNPAVSLITEAVTHTAAHHVQLARLPVELRPTIVEHHEKLARLMIDGDAAGASAMMREHFRVQLEGVRDVAPERFADVVAWK